MKKVTGMEISDFTYMDWTRDVRRPTIVLDHPVYGSVTLYTDSEKYEAALKVAGAIALSPTEVLRMFIADDMGYFGGPVEGISGADGGGGDPGGGGGGGAAKILAVKKHFPGSKVVDVIGAKGSVGFKIPADLETYLAVLASEYGRDNEDE